jgi:hypothetical protein
MDNIKKRGPKPLFGQTMTNTQRVQRNREKKWRTLEQLVDSAKQAQATVRVLMAESQSDDALDVMDITFDRLISGIQIRKSLI